MDNFTFKSALWEACESSWAGFGRKRTILPLKVLSGKPLKAPGQDLAENGQF